MVDNQPPPVGYLFSDGTEDGIRSPGVLAVPVGATHLGSTNTEGVGYSIAVHPPSSLWDRVIHIHNNVKSERE